MMYQVFSGYDKVFESEDEHEISDYIRDHSFDWMSYSDFLVRIVEAPATEEFEEEYMECESCQWIEEHPDDFFDEW